MSLDKNLRDVTSQDVATTAQSHALVVGGTDANGLVTQILTDVSGKVEVTGGAANLPVLDASTGALNASGPLFGTQIGGQDGTGKLQTLKVDNSGNLNVNLAAGSISGGNAAASATGSAVPANADYSGLNIAGNLVGQTGHSLTNAKAADVAIVDGSGNQITSFGGGTQFADNAASGLTPTGTLSMAWDSGNSKVRALKVDASQNLSISGTVTANQGTANATPWNQNTAQINGVTPLMGNGGTGTGSQRVTVASDTSAVANWGHGATAASIPANASSIGGLGRTTLPTAVAAGQLVNVLTDRYGRLYHVKPVTSNASSAGTAITTNTNTTIVAAPSAGNHLRIHKLWAQNSSATGTWCYWGNGSGVKTLPFYLSQYQPFSMSMDGGWELSSATGLFMNTATTGANIEWFAEYETLTD
jgi:hypothetical protein